MRYEKYHADKAQQEEENWRANAALAIDLQKVDLFQREQNLRLSQEADRVRQETERVNSAMAATDFTASYDPLNPVQRQQADRAKGAMLAAGHPATVVDALFERVNNQNSILDAYFATLQRDSGITDWEKDLNGNIDVRATEIKALQRRGELDEGVKTWARADRNLFGMLKEGGRSIADAMELVNESKRTREDVKSLVASQLWDPPKELFQDGSNNPMGVVLGVGTAKPGMTAAGQLNDSLNTVGYIWSQERLEMNLGYQRAKELQRRMSLGETPIFEQDENKVVKRDKDGIALIKEWRNLGAQKAAAEYSEAVTQQSEDAVTQARNTYLLKETSAGLLPTPKTAAEEQVRQEILNKGKPDPYAALGLSGPVGVPPGVSTSGDAEPKSNK
jgi:hypothetical protein